MKSRREFLAALGAAACAVSFRSFAQRPGLRRIGFLGPLSSAMNPYRIDALRAAMRGLGFVEGQTFSIEFRGQSRGIEQLRDLASALVRSKVDIIVANAVPETMAAMQATTAIPIVMAAANDAVAMRLVGTAQRPGGNVTGLTYSSPQMTARRLELLKEAFVPARRIGALVNPSNPMTEITVVALRATAKMLKVELAPFEVRAREGIGNAFGAMSRDKMNAFVIADDAVFSQNAGKLAELALSKRLPAIGSSEYLGAGGLMSYEVNQTAAWSRAASFVARIFKGARPGDLALEPATRFEIVLNKRGARMIGITFPQALAGRADRVLESGQDTECPKC